MEIKTLKTGQLVTNCYLLHDKKSKDVAIIDPGDDAGYIINQLNDLNKTPSKIIATHGHFDHILAANELKLAFNIPLLMHKEDVFLLKRMPSSAKYYTGLETGLPPLVNCYLEEEDIIKVGEYELKIFNSPGHTPGGVALYCKKAGVLFTGDTFFEKGGVGRTDFVYSNNKHLMKSIEKLLKLPNKTVVYPGHGNKTTIKKAKGYLERLC